MSVTTTVNTGRRFVLFINLGYGGGGTNCFENVCV